MKKSLVSFLEKISAGHRGPQFTSVRCTYGKITIYCITGPGENIIHLSFTREKHDRARKMLAGLDSSVTFINRLQKDFPHHTVFRDYFTGNLAELPFRADSPLIESGTSFQQAVWRTISTIPYGQWITYKKLAALAGSAKAVRAAGAACGANPLALIIPCHRVIAVNGLGGFAGGLEVKKALLALEGQAAFGTGEADLHVERGLK